jgi:hypothetical protein
MLKLPTHSGFHDLFLKQFMVEKKIQNTDESRYVKLGLLEISVKSKLFWSLVLNSVLFNLIYSSYLKFQCVEISGISK